MSLVLSTSWNAFHHNNGRKILSEITQLGFKRVELSFNLTESIFKDILKETRNDRISVSSLHNYCPIPGILERKHALPDVFSIASTNESERLSAVKYTKLTIDAADEIRARAVVLHCGRVDMEDSTRSLINLHSINMQDTKEYRDLRDKAIKERESLHKPFLDNALKSLEELNAYAKSRNILLGVETRFYLREIPSLREVGIILDKFQGSNIYYWHDTGHAQVMENLGFIKHMDFLDLYGTKMLGIHLHDVNGCKDHLAPLKGNLDFKKIASYIKNDTIKVIEAHYPATKNEIIDAKEFLEVLLDGKLNS
ncbi:MAG: sugar phosphate isomerase/epimerase [Candidatus Omnitrophota bacterium]|jgi:sugar phosphate isomerase/epimerase|nr:MAG: sugar phosphate isomerase/epimerase [Candidatus Omnitrophota bacterium]